VGKIAKKNSLEECVFVNSVLKYSAILSKIHSYRLLFFGDFTQWVVGLTYIFAISLE